MGREFAAAAEEEEEEEEEAVGPLECDSTMQGFM
jgi:hypothetical protein